MSDRNVQSLFCERLACPPEEYEERMFQQCLTWHARLVAPWLRRLNPSFFEADLRLIRDLGLAVSPQDIKASVGLFRKRNYAASGTLRMSLKLRVSGREATRLARELLARAPARPPEPGADEGQTTDASDTAADLATRAAIILDARRKRPAPPEPGTEQGGIAEAAEAATTPAMRAARILDARRKRPEPR